MYISVEMADVISHFFRDEETAQHFHNHLLLFRIRGKRSSIRNNLRQQLMKIHRILARYDRAAGAFFQRTTRNTRDFAAFLRDCPVFREGLWLLFAGNIRGGCLCQHIQYDLRGAHVVPEIFLLQALEPFVFAGG